MVKSKILILLTTFSLTVSALTLKASNRHLQEENIITSLLKSSTDVRFNIYNHINVSTLSKLRLVSNFFDSDIDQWAVKNHGSTFKIHYRNIIDYPVLIFDNQLKVDLRFSITYFAGDKGAPLFSKITITGYEGKSSKYICGELTIDFLQKPSQLLTESCLAQDN